MANWVDTARIDQRTWDAREARIAELEAFVRDLAAIDMDMSSNHAHEELSSRRDAARELLGMKAEI